MLTGSAWLPSGHGTAIGCVSDIKAMWVENALEIGVICATLGLIPASLIVGSIAHFLITQHNLKGNPEETGTIDYTNLMDVFLVLNLIGWFVNHGIEKLGLKLPLFVTFVLMGIASLAGTLLFILLMQTLAAVTFILFVLFPLMGRNYQAAVLSPGFCGFTLGATRTAIKNMTAVTKSNGPGPIAFIILPVVAAFFVDVANSLIIRFIV